MKWQPIETAPKDGTWVMLWRGKSSVGIWDPLVIGRYGEDPWNEGEEGWEWPEGPFDPFTEEGREHAISLIEEGESFYSDGFTHWIPLPKPPEE